MPSETSIKCLLSVAAHSSFTRAAEELFMTRQAVSRQISILEKELGAKLFERNTVKVALTPAGELYVDFFAECERRWAETCRKAEIILNQEGDNVYVGCLHGVDIGQRIFDLIGNAKQKFKINWERREPFELNRMLLNGELDVIFTFSDHLETDYDTEAVPFLEVNAVLAMSENEPRYQGNRSATDFQGETLYMAAAALPTPRDMEEFVRTWEDIGLCFQNVKLLPNRESVQSMVELGQGITICTDIEWITRIPCIRTIPLEKKKTIYCVWRRNEQRAQIKRFIHKLHLQ